MRRRLTIHGERATRRVRWLNPKWLTTTINTGEPALYVFAVCKMVGDDIELAHVSAQIGVDRRGRHVLPHALQVDATRDRTLIYNVPARIGHLREDCQRAVDGLNEKLRQQTGWTPLAGVTRGTVPTKEQS